MPTSWNQTVWAQVARFVVSIAVFAVAAPTALGWQESKTPRAYLDPEEADEDFAWQGEFATPGGNAPFGAQVIASGESAFDAVLYAGGLPGAGWDGEPPVRYHGVRDGNALLMTSDKDARRLLVTPEQARLVGEQDQVIGELPRVRRSSPTMGLAPPIGATVLFGEEPRFLEQAKTDGDLLAMGFHTGFKVGDFRLHLEFRTPYMPRARGQGRGNSGVYIQRRYEIQILDSFGLEGKANECGGLYRQTPPDVNMCLPPLTWQTYDIFFRAPRWDGEGKTKIANARVTVLHNGVAVHDDREIPKKTGAGKAETPELFPILFQDHRDPVRFRNIWIQFPPANGDPPGMRAPLDRGVFAVDPPLATEGP